MRQGALAAAVDGLRSDDLDVRCAAAATLAGLTRDDELARRCCSTEDARAALVDALERCEVKARTPRLDVDLGNAQIADAEAWADARAHEATLLLVAANLAPSWPAESDDRARLAKVLVAVLDATRRRGAGLDKAREQYLDQADAQPRVAKLAVALHDSALREALRGFRRQALHAFKLGLVHPASGEYMEFEAPLPEDFQTLVQVLEADREAQ